MEHAFNKYLASFLQICPELTPEELSFIRFHLTSNTFEKKDFYLKSGEVQKSMGYIYSGLLRSFYIDNEGKRVTVAFIAEHSYAADYPSFLRQVPSKYFLEALEPTVIVNLPYYAMMDAYQKFKGFERYGRLVAESILLKKQDRIESFLFETAEARYLDFLVKNPKISKRISLSHLSSYLGIQRQSLSRIRKNLSQR